MSKKHIEECIRTSLEGYFKDLRGTEPDGMYDMMVKVVETPAGSGDEPGRQQPVRVAEWLGLNRNTLRKKLVEHKLLKSFGAKDLKIMNALLSVSTKPASSNSRKHCIHSASS